MAPIVAHLVLPTDPIRLPAFINQVVGIASLPSIALRVILGAVLVWLIPARKRPASVATLLALRRTAGPTDRWTSRPIEGHHRPDRLQLSGLAARLMARLRHPRSEPVGLECGHNQAGTAVEITGRELPGPLSHPRGSVRQR